jgi:hypothetical protein
MDGTAWSMCAVPNRAHQEVKGELFFQLKQWLKGKPCKVYDAPFDVLLPADPDDADDDVDTVVQPAILSSWKGAASWKALYCRGSSSMWLGPSPNWGDRAFDDCVCHRRSTPQTLVP